ncbi:hypothetical protein AK812_SmicGene22213 [Symbiodinium microadriaticum]|uniref:Uncharacterized protein n=1 Tax=Symbiodinium microadriaticum TaxID=2951 RepID=A0A1Q9DKI1_SYMMI|nr:hypothetical protein AK812_SmicGene22213 [Symbiodinium microadriaticum]
MPAKRGQSLCSTGLKAQPADATSGQLIEPGRVTLWIAPGEEEGRTAARHRGDTSSDGRTFLDLPKQLSLGDIRLDEESFHLDWVETPQEEVVCACYAFLGKIGVRGIRAQRVQIAKSYPHDDRLWPEVDDIIEALNQACKQRELKVAAELRYRSAPSPGGLRLRLQRKCGTQRASLPMSHPSTEGHWARFGLTLILNDDLGADVTEDRLGARGWQIQLSAVWEFAHTVRAQIDLDMDAGTLHAKYSQHKMKLELQMPCELDCVIQHIAASLSFQRIHSVLYISCAECGKAHDETKSKSSLHIERTSKRWVGQSMSLSPRPARPSLSAEILARDKEGFPRKSSVTFGEVVSTFSKYGSVASRRHGGIYISKSLKIPNRFSTISEVGGISNRHEQLAAWNHEQQGPVSGIA